MTVMMIADLLAMVGLVVASLGIDGMIGVVHELPTPHVNSSADHVMHSLDGGSNSSGTVQHKYISAQSSHAALMTAKQWRKHSGRGGGG